MAKQMNGQSSQQPQLTKMEAAKKHFDEIFAAWIGYDENDELSVTNNLDDICEHFGTDRESFLGELKQRTDHTDRVGFVSEENGTGIDQTPTIDFEKSEVQKLFSSPDLMEVEVHFDRMEAKLEYRAVVDASTPSGQIEVLHRVVESDSYGIPTARTVYHERFDDSDAAFACYDMIKLS